MRAWRALLLGSFVAALGRLTIPRDRHVRRFAFPPLPQGRYRVTVMSWTRGSAADSVTLGFDGLRIIAALARYTGDIGCTMPVRPPSNER